MYMDSAPIQHDFGTMLGPGTWLGHADIIAANFLDFRRPDRSLQQGNVNHVPTSDCAGAYRSATHDTDFELVNSPELFSQAEQLFPLDSDYRDLSAERRGHDWRALEYGFQDLITADAGPFYGGYGYSDTAHDATFTALLMLGYDGKHANSLQDGMNLDDQLSELFNQTRPGGLR